jgi:hypothetical protein
MFAGDAFSMLASTPPTAQTQTLLQRMTEQTRAIIPDSVRVQFDRLREVQHRVVNYVKQEVIENFQLRSENIVNQRFGRHQSLFSIQSVEQTQHQRLIMAQPMLQRLHRMGVAEGYGGSYVPVQTDVAPHETRDYQMAVSGFCGLTATDVSLHQYWDSAMTEKDRMLPMAHIDAGNEPSSQIDGTF